jgi:hypothetical protein
MVQLFLIRTEAGGQQSNPADFMASNAANDSSGQRGPKKEMFVNKFQLVSPNEGKRLLLLLVL